MSSDIIVNERINSDDDAMNKIFNQIYYNPNMNKFTKAPNKK